MAFLACAIILSLVAAMPAGCGCGKSQPAEKAEEEVAEEVTGAEAGEAAGETAGETAGGKAGEAGEAGETETTGEKAPSGTEELPFSFDVQSMGGESYQSLVISGISWSDRGSYYRFVFEIRRTDGTNADRLPFSQSYYSSDRKRLFVFVTGVGVTDSRFRNEGDDVFLGHLPVSRITHTTGPSSLETTFVLDLVRPLRHYLHYETNPLRVILDVETV